MMLLFVVLAFCHFATTTSTSSSEGMERVFRVPESVPAGHHIGFIRGDTGESPDTLARQNFFVVYPPTVDGHDNGAAEKLLHVDERSGAISVRPGQQLDHEREQHPLYVLAVPVDGSAPVTVVVQVQDDNDNAPRFPAETIRLEISEYARINTALSLPTATDADAPPYNVQRYRIAAGNVNNAFRLASATPTQQKPKNVDLELVVNGRLDREQRQRYDLTIEAVDGGKPPKIGTLKVQVDVLDANDNHPEFVQARYTARISPRTAPGIPILRVNARDPDAGDNGRVSYGIVSQTLIGHPSIADANSDDASIAQMAPFQIDPASGTLSLARALPQLRQGRHASAYAFELLVVARDNGVPDPLESSTSVEVRVDASVDEAEGAGGAGDIHLGIIWLTEHGSGDDVTEGLPLGSVLARVSIERSHHGAGAGAVTGTTTTEIARSLDELKLSLLGGQSIICLRETDTPRVSLLVACGELDRERTPALQLDLLLRNGTQREGEVLLDHPLRVTLRDLNDNAPRWNQTQFRFRWVLDDAEDGDMFDDQNGSGDTPKTGPNYIRLVATDEDAGENARIRYTVIASDLVHIEPEMGILTLDEDKLPPCPADDMLQFQVEAADHGEPAPLRARVNISLRLVRHADAPQRVHFVQSVYELQVREDTEPGTCILQVHEWQII